MAEKLKEFDFHRMGRGKPGWYEKYLDGNIWQLGIEDAPNGSAANVESMRGSIAGYVTRQKKEGNFEGKTLRTQIVREYDEDGEPSENPEDHMLVIQLIDMDEDE